MHEVIMHAGIKSSACRKLSCTQEVIMHAGSSMSSCMQEVVMHAGSRHACRKSSCMQEVIKKLPFIQEVSLIQEVKDHSFKKSFIHVLRKSPKSFAGSLRGGCQNA
jgi:endonuclease IV